MLPHASFFSYLHESCQEWCRYPACALVSGRSGVIDLLSLSLSQSVPLGDFLLAPARSIETMIPRKGFFYLMSGSKTDDIDPDVVLHAKP